MGTPYDASAKDLIEFAPADWLAFLGQTRPPELVRVIDADLSATVSTATDKVIHVEDAEPWLAMVELQASWDGDLPFDLVRRYGLLLHRHRLPVSCVIVLLRPAANTSGMTGEFLQRNRLGQDWTFPFRVVRIWEQPADKFLMGPLGLLPLAPITAVDPDRADPVISMMRERINREATRAQAERLWEATSILLGLRFADDHLEGLRHLMANAELLETAYGRLVMGIGAVREARAMLLEFGTDKFGSPPKEVECAIQAIDDIPRLRRLTKDVLVASSWFEIIVE